MLVIFALIALVSASSADLQVKIFGGSKVTSQKYPSTVAVTSIGVNGSAMRRCAGLLVAPNWIATSTHCVLG